MSEDLWTAEEFVRAYNCWSHGDCPCCGLDLESAADGTACRAIGEGVLICGDCAMRGHHEIPGRAEFILRALIDVPAKSRLVVLTNLPAGAW
ncbi:MAG: hypothetical protein ACLQK8_00070 [Streptosporangiaceae bacterium]